MNRIAVDSDGGVLISGGFQAVNEVTRNYLARLNHDGSLDQGFLGGLSGPDNIVRSVAVLPSGKIVIVGDFKNVNDIPKNSVAQLLSDGTVDPTFTIDLKGPTFLSAQELAVEISGDLLVGTNTTSQVNGITRSSLFRLNLQPQYKSISGRVMTPGGQGIRNVRISAVFEGVEVASTVTSSLGYYSFPAIPVGTYMIRVVSKRYRFESRQVVVSGNLSSEDFAGLE